MKHEFLGLLKSDKVSIIDASILEDHFRYGTEEKQFDICLDIGDSQGENYAWVDTLFIYDRREEKHFPFINKVELTMEKKQSNSNTT